MQDVKILSEASLYEILYGNKKSKPSGIYAVIDLEIQKRREKAEMASTTNEAS